MSRRTLEEDILHQLWLVSCMSESPIPVMQGMLLAHLNTFRRKEGRQEITDRAFARKLYEMRLDGKVKRIRHFCPQSGNLWIALI